MHQSAGPHHAMDLAQKGDHQLLAGDMGEQVKGINEIKGVIREILQAGAADLMRARMGKIAQIFARFLDQRARDIGAVDFQKVTAHGPHQTAGAAADFEGAPVAALLRFQTAELGFKVVDDAGGGRQEFRVTLAAAPEGNVIAGVDGGIWRLEIRHGWLLAAGVPVEFGQ